MASTLKRKPRTKRGASKIENHPQGGSMEHEIAKRKKAANERAAQVYQAQRAADVHWGVRYGKGRIQYKGA